VRPLEDLATPPDVSMGKKREKFQLIHVKVSNFVRECGRSICVGCVTCNASIEIFSASGRAPQGNKKMQDDWHSIFASFQLICVIFIHSNSAHCPIISNFLNSTKFEFFLLQIDRTDTERPMYGA
jgi:hypothetical protein